MRLRPTRRLPGMLAAAFVVYLFATNSQVIWLYLVAALIAGLAVIGVVGPAVAVRGTRPSLAGWSRSGFQPPLAQDRGRLFRDDLLTLRLDLGIDRPPVTVDTVKDSDGAILRAQCQLAGRQATLELDVGMRGMTRLEGALVASTWPLGMARAHKWAPLDFAVVAHPRYALPRGDRYRGTRDSGGASSARGPGDEFLGLREYQSGDSQRRVHWPTTARTGKLMVVETAQEASNSTTYELELDPGARQAAELAVGIAASLGAGSVAGGMAMTMAVPGQPRSLARWTEVLGALARAQPGEASPGRQARDAIRIRASSRQVTVTRGDDVAVVDASLALEAALALCESIR